MPAEVSGIDHIYLSVSDLDRAERFYDCLVSVLGFRKRKGILTGDPHLFFYNRQFGFVLRPARTAIAHDPYAPGLHHFCLRVNDAATVDRAARELRGLGIEASEPRLYPEYAPDYYATFFADPDGIRLEITNFREERRRRMFDFDLDAEEP